MITRKDLSEEQEKAFVYILDFLSSNRRQMLLAGYAGTGKTTLLNVLLDHFDADSSHDVYCTAPTNEAVRVISKLTGRTKFDKTIYSLLGLALVEVDDKPPKLKVIKKKSSIGDYNIVFIDEASMIQSELFDLMQDQLKQYSHLKVIYIGDDAQLPPVKDEGRDSKVFKIQDTIKLVEIQRTAKDNPIIEIATQIRENLDSPVDVFKKETKLIEKDGVEFNIERNAYLDMMYTDFKSEEYKKDPNYVRVAAYTNKTVNALNQRIRKQLFEGKELKEYMENEDVVVDVPVVDPLEQYIVFTVGERLRVKKAKLFEDHEEGFKYWSLTVLNYEGRNPTTRLINVIHKDYIRAYRIALSKYARTAKELIAKGGNRGAAWGPYFKFKNNFSWVKYSYAMTIHKCQGGTFNRVYIINKDCNVLTWNHVERNKLKYVAFTRASNLLRII